MATSGRIPIKQLYDENGVPFYPITHVDLILGDKEKLSTMGNIITTVDLSKYLIIPYSGVFNLHIMNNMTYTYEGNIMYTNNEISFPYNTDLIIARDIPSKYRSSNKNIICNAVNGNTDIVNVYISADGSLVARVTPKSINSDIEEYTSSVNRLYFNGLFIRSGLEE